MEKKSSLSMYCDVANDVHLPFYKVQAILSNYIDLQKTRLRNGQAIQLFGIVKLAHSRDELIPNTLGTDAGILSKQLNIPVFTIANILTGYLRSVREELREAGHSYSIAGLCTLKRYTTEDGGTVILTNKAANAFPEFRVFTSKFLRKVS